MREDEIVQFPCFLISSAEEHHPALGRRPSLYADGSREAIDQIVSDCPRPRDRRRSNVGVLAGVEGAYFLWRELLVNVGKSNPIKLEMAGQRAAFPQSAKPPLD